LAVAIGVLGLYRLQETDAHEQADVLADRAAALADRAPVDRPCAAASLQDELRKAGTREQADAVADRAAALADRVLFEHPGCLARLLDELRRAGTREQADALASRLPAAGMFELFLEHNGPSDPFRFGRETDGTPATPWDWEDLDLSLVVQ